MVINSGCSNVCTGKPGYRDAVTMASDVAKLVGTTAEKILVASTGVIGHRLPMDKIRNLGNKLPMDKVRGGIPQAVAALGTDNDERVIAAIMTTDTRPKTAVVQTTIDGKRVTVAGIIKGAGMIAPSLATMIGVITTDVAISPALLHKALKAAAGETFNGITVDSDTSTSDTVAVFASGSAGNKPIVAGGAAYDFSFRGVDDPGRIVRTVDRALHDALAVYYFPGMWDWDPAIVLPIVYQAFERSVREQCAGRDLDAGQLAAVQDARGLLEQYALWAPAVDRFAPIRVACDVDVQVPDPGDPATGIVTPGGGAVRYF